MATTAAAGALTPDELFKRFINEVGLRLHLPRLSRRVLKRFTDTDVTVSDITALLGENAYYRHFLDKAVAPFVKEGEKPSLDLLIPRFGMQNTRNLLTAIQMTRQFRRAHPTLDESGKPKVPVTEALRYALGAEEAVSGKKGGHPDTAFVAGLVFDALAGVAANLEGGGRAALDTVDLIYQHGLKSAKIGSELAKLVPELANNKFIFAACLVHDAGKAAMAMLDPGYARFAETCLKAELPRSVRHLLERERYGFTHEVFSSLCAYYFPVLDVVREPILFHHEPYLLLPANRDHYNLAALIAVATNMATHFALPANTMDPVIDKWRGPELKDFSVKPQALITLVAKLQRMGIS